MAQPTAYNRQYDFNAFQTSNPTTPLPSSQVSAELNALETTVDGVLVNIAKIQRDDGALANTSVGIDQLKTEVTFGLETVVNWATSTVFALNAGAWNGSNLYRCIVAHTSGTFSTDLSNNKWTLLVDASAVTTAASNSASTASTKASEAAASAVTSAAYAIKSDGAVTGSEFSAKAWAIGGTGVANNAKDYATKAEDSAVTGSDYSALHYAAKATAQASTATTQANTATTKANEASASATAAAASAAGVYWKAPVKAASTGNLTLSGTQTVDGISLGVGDRILVKNQSSAPTNGVYVVAASTWARSVPLNAWDEFVGAAVVVSQGSVNADTAWICTVDAGGSLGSTAITWGAFGVGDLKGSNNLSDVSSAATAFSNLKQAASATATGVVELATDAEAVTGTDTARAITAANLAATFPTIRSIPQNSKSADYTLVLADAGKHLYHPGGDTSARTFTIPANASVAYPIGTAITFVNDTGGGVISIAITSDVLVLSPAGTTGTRALAANGVATCIKMTATRWMISGSGLT